MQDEISKVLSIHTVMGVNAIAKALNKPVATVQKYLNSQSYFVKTEDRKWTLPGTSHAVRQPNRLIEEAKELLTLMNISIKKMQSLVEVLEATPKSELINEPKKKEPVQIEANYPEIQKEIQEALLNNDDLWLRSLWENIDVKKLHSNINALFTQSEKDGQAFGNIYMHVIHNGELDDDIDISRMFPIFTEILEKSQKDKIID